MDKALLFKPHLPEAEVELPGIGTVRVRALSRQEAKSVQKLDSDDQRDLHMIAIGMVDPSLSVSEVKQWAEASPAGEMEPVSDKIAQLSGLTAGSAKEAMNNFEANPEDEFEFYLAQKLHMTVARLHSEMSNDEFVKWHIYYQRKAQNVELERLKGR